MSTRIVRVTLDGRTTTVRGSDPSRVLNVGPAGTGTGGGAVDSVNGQTGAVVLDADDLADGTTNHVFTAADDTKLAGVATGATANDTDANLKVRANHTGTQAISTVTGLQTALDDTDTALATHAADTTAVHGITDTSVLATDAEVATALSDHAAATNPHPTYLTAAEGDAAYQPLDGDLTTIAALDSATAGALVTDGAGWFRKTYAQLKTALSLVKADVGLGSVDNTADTAKPVSTAQQTALDLKANLASPALTGTPTAPTQSAGNNSTRLATTAYADTADALKADLASPTFTGDPKAPTASPGDNDTSIATTAFVTAAVAAGAGASPFDGCTIHHSAAQSTVASGTDKVLDFDTDDYDDSTKNYHYTSASNLTGTVTKTASSLTLTGSGTSFLSELGVNQIIDVPGTATERLVVASIQTNTSLTLRVAPANTASGQTATRVRTAIGIPTTGKYRMSYRYRLNDAATGNRALTYRKNLATNLAQWFHPAYGSTAVLDIFESGVLSLTAGDTVDVVFNQTSGGTVPNLDVTTNVAGYLTVEFLGT